MNRDFVDFFAVEPQHVAIHERLNAWASWVKVRPHGWQVSPMFRQYRSHAWQWERPEVKVQANIPEALEIEQAVSQLPEKHRTAIRWQYVWCGSPLKACRELGVSKAGLMELVNQGRTMVRDRVCG